MTGIQLQFTVTALESQGGRNGGTWYWFINTLPRGKEPRANSIADWSGPNGGIGHVAFVEAVSGDNVTISEANWASPADGLYNDPRVLSKQQMASRSGYSLNGYIYVGGTPPPAKFTIGGRVQANSVVKVRDSAGGNVLGQRAGGDRGTIVGGMVGATYGGPLKYYQWWNVNWDSGTDGWSIEDGLTNGGAEIQILTQSFTYAPGTPITIECVLWDESGSTVLNTTVFGSESLSLNPQTRIVGTTGQNGHFTLFYSGTLTQTLGPGTYPIVLAAGKARKAFTINLEATATSLFTANTLRLNLGVVGQPVFLTQDTLVFSPRVTDSTIPVLTESQVFDSAMKLSREAGVWLFAEGREFLSDPANIAALGLSLKCFVPPNPVSTPICAGSVKFLAESAAHQIALSAGHAIINHAPDYDAAQRAQAHQFLDQVGLGLALFGLKPDGSLLRDLDLFSATWDTLNATMEMVHSDSGALVGLNLVGLGTAGKEARILSCRLLPPDSAQSFLMTVIPALPEVGTVSGVGTYPEGANVTVLADPNPGYSFLNWTDGGSEVTNTTSFTFVATSNRTLIANFTAVPAATCIDTNESNDSSLTATFLTPGASQQGRICTTNDVDWFKVNVTEPGAMAFNLTVPANNDHDLELFGPDTYYIKGS